MTTPSGTSGTNTVGPAVARNARPEKIRNGTLFVRVRAATWMQQLQYMKDIIVEKLNQRLEREVVTGIFFMVGDIPSTTPPKDSDAPPPPVDAARLPERELGRIDDPRAPGLLKEPVAEPLEEAGLGILDPGSSLPRA